MRIKEITGPTVEPVSMEDAKTHLRVDVTDDDAWIIETIEAAREMVQGTAGRALITQTWELALDSWPADGVIELPWAPLQSVTSVKYTDEDGDESTFSSDDYLVDTYSEPGRLILKRSSNWPSDTLQEANGILVRYVCGYGDNPSDVPKKYAKAIRLMVGHWYENREAVVATGAVPQEMPMAVESLLWMDRVKVF